MLLRAALLTVATIVSITAVGAEPYRKFYNAGLKDYKAKKYEEAIQKFKEGLAKSYDAGSKYNCLSYAYYSALNAKKYDEAMAFATQIFELQSDLPARGILFEADVLRNMKKYKEAIKLLAETNISKWNKSLLVSYHYKLGSIYYLDKQYKKALEAYEKYLKSAYKDYSRSSALLRLGNTANFGLKDKDAARDYYMRTIEIKGVHKSYKQDASFRIAVLDAEKKDYQAAVDRLKKNLKTSKGYHQALCAYYAGIYLLRLGEKDEAKAMFEKGIATKKYTGGYIAKCKKQLEKLNPDK
ncbi:MAG: hypothetical protein GY750_19175 [Lentisphaerae bacterium]|nr:hypothetical protein [Lentisphaerota bacterium]MCP4103520.1 hypothetical protein [Lentisphaerota bacterium]